MNVFLIFCTKFHRKLVLVNFSNLKQNSLKKTIDNRWCYLDPKVLFPRKLKSFNDKE